MLVLVVSRGRPCLRISAIPSSDAKSMVLALSKSQVPKLFTFAGISHEL